MSREAWERSLSRTVLAFEGEGEVLIYAKETLEDGWNTWAILERDGKRIRSANGYRRRNGRLVFYGALHADVWTPRIFEALENRPPLGVPLPLTEQIELEEWLALYGYGDSS